MRRINSKKLSLTLKPVIKITKIDAFVVYDDLADPCW